MQNNHEQIKTKLNAYLEEITNDLSKGNSIEIHPSRDGVKVLSVKKKIINERK